MLITYIKAIAEKALASIGTIATLKEEIADLKTQLAKALADDAADDAAIDAALAAATAAQAELLAAQNQSAALADKLAAITEDQAEATDVAAALAVALGIEVATA